MLRKTILLPSLLFSLNLMANRPSENPKFKEINEIYADREKGFEKSIEGMDKIEALIKSTPNLSVEEKTYIVSQFGRLAIYAGGLLENVEVKKQRKVLERCIDFLNTNLSATKSPEYYYHYLSCVAIRGKKASNFADRGIYAYKLSAVQDDALATSKDSQGQFIGGYEGGGLLRVMSGIRGNRKAKGIPGLDLYGPKQGLEFANLALATPEKEYSASPFLKPYSGVDYFENHYYKAYSQITLALDNTEEDTSKKLIIEAQETLEKTLKLIARREKKEKDDPANYPSDRAPERAFYKNTVELLLKDVKESLEKSDWKKELEKRLEA